MLVVRRVTARDGVTDMTSVEYLTWSHPLFISFKVITLEGIGWHSVGSEWRRMLRGVSHETWYRTRDEWKV